MTVDPQPKRWQSYPCHCGRSCVHQVGKDVTLGLVIGDNHIAQHQTDESSPTMPRILRVNDSDGDPIGSSESILGVGRLLEGLPVTL
jgi:hypothetical protein